MPNFPNYNVPNPPKDQDDMGLGNTLPAMIDNVNTGMRGTAVGLSEALSNQSRKYKRIIVSKQDILRMEQILSQKYPQWDKKELRKYLLSIAQIVPNLFNSPYAVEEAVKKAFNYGGIDPNMLLQYSTLMAKGL